MSRHCVSGPGRRSDRAVPCGFGPEARNGQASNAGEAFLASGDTTDGPRAAGKATWRSSNTTGSVLRFADGRPLPTEPSEGSAEGSAPRPVVPRRERSRERRPQLPARGQGRDPLIGSPVGVFDAQLGWDRRGDRETGRDRQRFRSGSRWMIDARCEPRGRGANTIRAETRPFWCRSVFLRAPFLPPPCSFSVLCRWFSTLNGSPYLTREASPEDGLSGAVSP